MTIKVQETPFSDADSRYVPFRITLDIMTRDELACLMLAVARMTNGHGLALFDLLEAKCQRFDVELPFLRPQR